MVDITAPFDPKHPEQEFNLMRTMGTGPGRNWSVAPYLQSSDVVSYRVRDSMNADAKDASRANPYGRSARRNTSDAVIGTDFKLALNPNYVVLGVDDQAARDWADAVEEAWALDADSTYFTLDAQRKQRFTDLMRTCYNSFYVSGETLATIEWKLGYGSTTRTCLNIIAPERLSDPRGMQDFLGRRRMGVERGVHGEPIAYNIRTQHPSDGIFSVVDIYNWKKVPRYTPWGRLNVIHHYEHDQADMTRGLTGFTSVLMPMRLLQDYTRTELESAALRATYAAVIESELDYEEAMKVIGPEMADSLNSNPRLQLELKMMADRAEYYRGQEFKFGKSKVAHLLPNEKLHMVQGTQNASAVKDFNSVNLYEIAAGLGVDYASLTKNYSDTNYSGARAALYDVWRSYEVSRATFSSAVAMPFFGAWLEEKITMTEEIPMLGNGDFHELRDAICRGTFDSWGKPRLDPLKENQADIALYERGAMSLKDLCANDGRDWIQVLTQRAREKAEMEKLGLKPEDLDWSLIMNAGADPTVAKGDSGGSTSS